MKTFNFHPNPEALMSAVEVLERPTDEAPTELTVIPRETALSVLTDPQEFDAFYLRVKAVVDAHVPDVSTPKGRDAIKALAFKVVKSKTAIDAAGKLLTEEWRTQTAKVDAARKAIRDKLDDLRDEARRPVTEWEAAEDERVDRVRRGMEDLQSAAVITLDDTSDSLARRIEAVRGVAITDEEYQEYAAAARSHQATTIEALTAGIARLAKEEADRAELERHREEAARRDQEERDRQHREALAREEAERAARAAAEAEARQAAEAERQRVAAEQAEAARIAAEERAKAEAEAAEARREAEAARAETARLEGIERDRQAAARKAEEQARIAAAEEARKAANKAHRGKIMAAAKAAIMALNVDEETAKRIVLAIVADTIPAVSIKF